MFESILYGTLLLCIISSSVFSQIENKSTDLQCVNNYANLECKPGYVIFITRSEHVYRSSQCFEYGSDIDYNSEELPSQEHCQGIDESCESYKKRCNGLQNCHVKIDKKSHQIGVFGGNCNFESNIANIYYSCVPKEINKEIPSFDICHDSPKDIFDIEEGFIHSPNYPYYYQNSRNCQINIRTRQYRLVIYMIKMNVEGKGIFSRKPNDFLQIQDGHKYHGKNQPADIIYNGTENKVELKFKTDWGTSTYLDFPKGFLLYFKRTPSNDVTKKEVIYVNSNGQKSGSHGTHNHSLIAILIAVIGLLVVVIFTLLLIFRRNKSFRHLITKKYFFEYRKQTQFNEEDNIYDTSKNEYSQQSEYHNASIVSEQEPQSTITKFNSKLKKVFTYLTHTTHFNTNSPTNQSMNTSIKISYDEEDDEKIESLKIENSNVSYTKQENEQANGMNTTSNTTRAENEYVTLPTLNDSSLLDHEKLKIYEVKLDNNNEAITINNRSPLSPVERNKVTLQKKDSEIYQSINDIENYMKIGREDSKNQKQAKKEDVYSTPINTRVAANVETPINVQNYSQMQLLDDEDEDENC